jgi:hypothetical protein
MSDQMIQLTPSQVKILRLVVEDLACYALAGWEDAMKDERPEEFQQWKNRVDESLRLVGSKHDFESIKPLVG